MLTRYEVFEGEKLGFTTLEIADYALEEEMKRWPEDIWRIEYANTFESHTIGYEFKVSRVVPDAQDME